MGFVEGYGQVGEEVGRKYWEKRIQRYADDGDDLEVLPEREGDENEEEE